ncbi:MAG: ATP-binding protein, partial [Acidobacteriales bacterium]|nr:ATP-binding protein [Terriglobales bacterium]
EVERTGGDVRVVLGEYGTGKSHFFELAAQEALERNFLVATASLDVREVPPNRPQRIYNSLIRNLRYPDSPNPSDSGTLVPLFDRILTQPAVYAPLMEKLRETVFSSVLYNYSQMRSQPGEALNLLLDWISGEKVYISEVRRAVTIRSKEFPMPALSLMTTSADQYCYLLSGWGWLATQVGYAGLAVLLDESEHYSLLNVRGQERADNFFRGLMYTALAAHPHCKIREEQLEHHRNAHRFLFTDRSQLLVMFAVTPSASTFDYHRWLDEGQIIVLNDSLPAQAVDDLMARLSALHRQAYGYERSNHISEIAQNLLECLDGKLINLRQMIRLATEISDICYAHPEFSMAQAAAELRRALLGR